MKNLSIETATELAKLQIEEELDALKFVPAITELLKKWNGKQINKRLDSALKQIDPRIGYHVRYGTFYISVAVRSDYISVPSGHGVSLAHYLSSRQTELLQGEMIDLTGNGKAATIEGNLNAAPLLESMTRRAESIRKSCEQATEQIEKVPDLIAERDRLAKAVEDFSRGLNAKIRDYFDLDISVRT